jgi:hypothetical protein
LFRRKTSIKENVKLKDLTERCGCSPIVLATSKITADKGKKEGRKIYDPQFCCKTYGVEDMEEKYKKKL